MKPSTDLTPGEAEVDALRAVVPLTPEYAVDQIHRLLTDRAGDPGSRVDLLILLAETYQRLGRTHFAVAAASDAAEAVNVLLPGDELRRTVALGVAADIAVWTGDDAALQTCTTYSQTAVNDGGSDQRRITLAGALRAVALYRIDCNRGRATLTRLLHRTSNSLDPTAIMIRTGYAAMQDGCDPTWAPASPGPLTPMPGGVLHPGLEFPAAQYLAQRVRRHPVRHHTCPSCQSAR